MNAFYYFFFFSFSFFTRHFSARFDWFLFVKIHQKNTLPHPPPHHIETIRCGARAYAHFAFARIFIWSSWCFAAERFCHTQSTFRYIFFFYSSYFSHFVWSSLYSNLSHTSNLVRAVKSALYSILTSAIPPLLCRYEYFEALATLEDIFVDFFVVFLCFCFCKMRKKSKF